MRIFQLALLAALLLTGLPAASQAAMYATFDGTTSISDWMFHTNLGDAAFSVEDGQLQTAFVGDTGETVDTYAAARLMNMPWAARGVLADIKVTAAAGANEAGLMGSLQTSSGNTLFLYVFVKGGSDTVVWGYQEVDSDGTTVNEFSHESSYSVINTNFSLGLHFNDEYLRWGVRYPDGTSWSVSQIPHNTTVTGINYYELRVRQPTSATVLYDNVRTIE